MVALVLKRLCQKPGSAAHEAFAIFVVGFYGGVGMALYVAELATHRKTPLVEHLFPFGAFYDARVDKHKMWVLARLRVIALCSEDTLRQDKNTQGNTYLGCGKRGTLRLVTQRFSHIMQNFLYFGRAYVCDRHLVCLLS